MLVVFWVGERRCGTDRLDAGCVDGAPDSAPRECARDPCSVVGPVAVHGGEVVLGVALPEEAAGLGSGPVSRCFEELVVVACVADVEFGLPEEFDVGAEEGEELHWLVHVGCLRVFITTESISIAAAKKVLGQLADRLLRADTTVSEALR